MSTDRYTTALVLGAALGTVVPTTVFAAGTTLSTVLDQFTTALGSFVGVLMALAVAVFIWGVVTFMARAGDDAQLAAGRKRMLWGVVALFIIVSMWGLVVLVQQMSGVDTSITKCSSPRIDLNGNTVTSCF